jgi:alanyl-tRNA synthetase
MSGDRLYYNDSYLVEFDAVVRDVESTGDRWQVRLDRSAFYPTSGGQPHDTGTIGDAKVIDVADRDDGEIAHFLDRPLDPDARVRGRIDWARRFDHMQQHTGQHVLSAAFDRELAARTVSFHLGTRSSTIDLDKELSPDQIAAVESTANRVLWEDREVLVRFVTAAEAAKLPLRKEPARTGELRIVEIKDYDLSACGGTHVSRTGAIGMVAIAGFERFKGGMRVEFVCGNRALDSFRDGRDVIGASVRLLSVLPRELPSAIEKLQQSQRGQQKTQEAIQERLAGFEAGVLAAKAQTIGDVKLVAEAVEGYDAVTLKKLAASVATQPATMAVLVTREAPLLVVVARNQNLTVDAGAILKTILDRFGGKGGGKGAMAQGGGINGSPADVLIAARDAVARG